MRYVKRQATPVTLEQLTRYVQEEFRQIQLAFLNIDIQTMKLVELHKEPDKPETGIIAFADGVDWNPGAGRGLYQYKSNAWHEIQVN